LTVLLTIDDTTLRNELIIKLIHSSDFYINFYSDDGGCDEGPGYWVHGAGRLIQFMDLLSQVSNGVLSWSTNELIHRMGTYIYKVHIDGKKFVNFADSSLEGDVAYEQYYPFSVFKYGQLFNDTKMIQFASYLNALNDEGRDKFLIYKPSKLSVFVYESEANEKLKSVTPKAPQLSESWLQNLQVIIYNYY